jgi:hypothetical protein
MIATQDASKNSTASAGMLLQFWWLSLGSFASSLPIKVFFCKCQVREQVPPSSHTSPHLTHLAHLTSLYPCLLSSFHLNLPCCAEYALASCAIQLAINQRIALLFTSGWFMIDRAGTASRPAISYLTRYPILHFNPHYCPLMAPKPH